MLCSAQRLMAQISGEYRQPGIEIGTFPMIPSQQGMYRKRMPKVMEPGTLAATGVGRCH